jgi:hypothetical protein
MNEFFNKIESSFKAAMRGEENLSNLIWKWGLISYLLSYFVIDRIIKINDIRFVDVIISLLMTVYFGWHIYVLRKCSPKKPKLSAEEKKLLRLEARRQFTKKLLRKLFLQEPITKWDPVFVATVIDLFSLAIFLNYAVN